MRILVIGSGGREHAFIWKLRQSPRVHALFCLPGNGGIASAARCIAISASDHEAISAYVRSERIDCVIIGPEVPLASGLTDHLQSQGVPVLGPTQRAAQLESSKVFSKEFMARQGIPTAPFIVCRDPNEALRALDSASTPYPVVLKADGLAAGKGVVIARTPDEARDAVRRIMMDKEFGAAGERMIVEEFLEGIEASYIVFTDGETIVPAVAARDHKAAYDNDAGPNTGGMGAYSTDDILSPELAKTVLDGIVRRTVDGMRAEGSPFQGILYTGLMLTANGPKVLEFNVRMGDPECQVIIPRLETDLAALCEAVCSGRLKDCSVSWDHGAAICVVVASGGYPGAYSKGKKISGLMMAEEDKRVAVFHAGTRLEGDTVYTDGGRVLGVTAMAPDLASAMMSAYEAVGKIHFDGMHYRRDIGVKGLKKSAEGGLR
jgi:phosphoribosylamine---glycine ligase